MPDATVWLMLAVPPVAMLALGLVLGGHIYARAHKGEMDDLKASHAAQVAVYDKLAARLHQLIRKSNDLPPDPRPVGEGKLSPPIPLDAAHRARENKRKEEQVSKKKRDEMMAKFNPASRNRAF